MDTPVTPFFQDACSILKGAFDCLNDYIGILDNKAHVVLANNAWEEFVRELRTTPAPACGCEDVSSPMQISFAHLINTPIGMCVHKNEDIFGNVIDVIKGRKPEFFAEVNCCRFDRQRWFLLHMAPLDTSHAFFLMHIKEVTSYRTAEQNVKKLNEFLQIILNSLPHPFYVIDVNDYTIKLANEAAKQAGIEEDMLCYHATHSASHPCESDVHPCPLKKILETKKSIRVEHVHKDNKGKERVVEVNAHPIFDDKGNVIQFIEYTIDITQRKQAEENVRQKTIELERSNKELQMFASTVSHDLKQPLTSVAGYLELIESEMNRTRGENLQVFMKNAQAVTRRMCGLIDDLLEYSKIRKESIPMESVDSNEIVKNAIANLHSVIKSQKARVKCGELPVVWGNAMLLERLFQNLIGNAIKFQAQGTVPHIKITAETNANSWVFSVSDNGIGIEKEYLTQIFDVFKRLHSNVHYSGHGIGLAACKRIVECHDGSIWVESEQGKGSTFFFTIPVNNKLRSEHAD
ncbi:MAG: ATP-binding protein [Candidatus Auribacterota bacterium]